MMYCLTMPLGVSGSPHSTVTCVEFTAVAMTLVGAVGAVFG